MLGSRIYPRLRLVVLVAPTRRYSRVGSIAIVVFIKCLKLKTPRHCSRVGTLLVLLAV